LIRYSSGGVSKSMNKQREYRKGQVVKEGWIRKTMKQLHCKGSFFLTLYRVKKREETIK